MHTQQQVEDSKKLYRWSHDELIMIHMKEPTVLEVVLYMATITGQDAENILKVMEMENEASTNTTQL